MPFIRKIATVNLNAISTRVKQSLLKDFVWNNDLDVIFLQEVAFENFSFINTHVALVNISSDGKGTGILLRKSIEYSNVVMHSNGRLTSVSIDGVNYINVYAHSGSKFKKERDKLFTEEILIHLFEHTENVLLGDFNCIIDQNDSNGSVKNISNGLKNLVSSLNLVDVELKKNHSRKFTFIRGNSKSRLDRIYSSTSFVENIRSLETIAVSFSDHHSVVIKIEITDAIFMNFHGKGYWKMNLALLNEDEIKEKFKNNYLELKERNSFQSLSYWWNNDFKKLVKRFFKNENYLINQQSHRAKHFYYCCLKEIVEKQSENIDVSDEIALVKSKLMELEQQRLNKFKYKLKAHTLHSEEKLSLFQLTSFINRTTESNLLKLRLNGTVTSDPILLRNGIYEHFSDKFKKQSNESTNYDDVLKYVTKSLSENDRNELIRPIELSELQNVIQMASKKSSPGPDGINYEFYSVFFDVIKEELLNLFNSYLINGEYPPGLFTEGIITLIPKKGDKYDLKNKRPISMLNTDCKLFTKILWIRLQSLLGKLLGTEQSACVEDKSCVDNLRILRNIMIRANSSHKFKGTIMSLDLEKAFDRVDHEFLWAILKKFKFPATFVDCLSKLYKNATSKVLFNGFLTSPFKISCSVRQGCPLSMALFALYIEPLIRMIDQNVKGVLIDQMFVKIIAYADDINIFIRNNHEFDVTLQLINYYSLYSKIKLNLQKSQFIRLNNCSIGPQLIQEVDEIKILGVKFQENYEKTIENNFYDIIKKIKLTIALQHGRRLNLFQKTYILNTYILSKLWYVVQLFPPDNKHIALLKSICGKFIWKGHFYKVDRSELYLPVYKGGLALVDVESKSKALFIKNILFTQNNSRTVIDSFMLKQSNNPSLTRNTKQWIKLADDNKNTNLTTSKQFYDFFIESLKITIKKQTSNPNLQWQHLFENIDQNFLCTEAKSTLFMVQRDIIPHKSKLFRHGIRGTDSPICDSCKKIDTLQHRIKNCKGSQIIWSWLNDMVKNRFRINVIDSEELLSCGINSKNYKYKAALWLTVVTMTYCLSNYSNGNLEELKDKIRCARWNSRVLFKKHFKHFLDVC